MNKGCNEMKIINVFFKMVLLFIVFFSMAFSDNVILTNKTIYSNCEIIQESEAQITIRLFKKSGNKEMNIPVSQILKIERFPRNESTYTTLEYWNESTQTKLEEANKVKPLKFEPENVGLFNNFKISNGVQLMTGLTLTVIGYDYIIRHSDTKDLWDDFNYEPKSKEVRKNNVILFTGILSTVTGLFNVMSSINQIEVKANHNNITLSYKF